MQEITYKWESQTLNNLWMIFKIIHKEKLMVIILKKKAQTRHTYHRFCCTLCTCTTRWGPDLRHVGAPLLGRFGLQGHKSRGLAAAGAPCLVQARGARTAANFLKN